MWVDQFPHAAVTAAERPIPDPAFDVQEQQLHHVRVIDSLLQRTHRTVDANRDTTLKLSGISERVAAFSVVLNAFDTTSQPLPT